MKLRSIILISFFSLISILFFGCNSILGIFGSNNIVDVDIPEIPTGYTKVYLGVSIEGNIIQSDDFSLEIKANENLVEYLIYEKDGDTLKIYLDNDYQYNNVRIQADITMPSIIELNSDTSSKTDLQGFDQSKLLIKGSTSSIITVSDITVDELEIKENTSANIHVSSITINTMLIVNSETSSVLTVEGSGNPDLILDADTSSNINLKNIVIDDADIDLGTSAFGEITMNNGTLNANLGTSSTLKVHGDYVEGNINIGVSASLVNN